MKTAWSIVSFLAVVHLLALALFGGWLWQSGRLDRGRIEAMRELFAPTIIEAERLAREAEETAERLKVDAMEESRRQFPPLSSAGHLAHLAQVQEAERQAMRRLRNERAALTDQFDSVMAQIEEREKRLDAGRRQWLETIEAERARREDEQFAKTVRQYESIQPRQGKNMLMVLIESGEMTQAVAYLDAMNARAAGKILQEFKTEAEIQLATELLERLRTFSLPPDLAGENRRRPQDAFNADPSTRPREDLPRTTRTDLRNDPRNDPRNGLLQDARTRAGSGIDAGGVGAVLRVRAAT